MRALKKGLIFILRVAGIGGLAGLLAFGWYRMEIQEPQENAKAVFAGTKQDADCTILLSRGKCVVIDTGEEADAPHIAEILKEQGISRIDCMILTHPDQDHIGGAGALLNLFSVEQIIVPYFNQEKAGYQELQEKLALLQIPVQTLSRDRQYIFGEWNLRIFPPEKFYYEKSNDYSLAVLAEHGENRIFIAGDAQRKRLTELLGLELLEADLYQVACHGRDSEKSTELIEKLRPEYAVVTARKPEKKVREALEKAGTKIFCTVPDDVIFLSDGKELYP